MKVARINFSHGDFTGHRQVIENIRTASRPGGAAGRDPGGSAGAEMRIASFGVEKIELKRGDPFTLTTDK